MPIQTDYAERMRLPSPGTIAGSDYGSKTGNVEEADGIGFGLPVSQGTGDKGVALAGALADFLGISIRDVTVGARETNPDQYNQYQNLGYVNRGQIWVEVAVAVSAGDPVHFNATTGAWAISGGTGPIVGARYVTSAASGGRAIVELQARGA